ncbi:MAG: hypothetical protein GXX78_02775 [Bacteroidales bacterium]|nr:hypothetical protein [Bacteroidales bacterium]
MNAMKPLRPTLFFLVVLFVSLNARAGIFDFTRKLDSIQLIYNDDELRLPGESFNIGVVAYFKNGKVRKTWNLESGLMPWFHFNVEVKGGIHSLGRIKVNNALQPSAGKYVEVSVWPNKAKHLTSNLLLPLNYEKEIEIQPTSDVIKAPGFGFSFKVVSMFDNGVVREYEYAKGNDLSKHFILAVNGGVLWRDKFLVEKDIAKIYDHSSELLAISKRNPECRDSLTVQLDYIADYKLYLTGGSGSDGANGSGGSGGTTGSNGGDGGGGQDGSDGSDGPEIGVWADMYFDEVLGTELMYVYAQNFWTGQEYRYLINPQGGKLEVTSRGGRGGDGGNGGDGGSGGKGQDGGYYTREESVNDSTTTMVTYRERGGDGGDGGIGGDGGRGGSGGRGGNIYLYFTDDALDYQDLIKATSIGGSSGSGGRSGSGGSSGNGGDGSPSGSVGSSGRGGSSGSSGWSGSRGEIVIDYTDEFVE